MKKLLALSAVAACAWVMPANAVLIATFGQTSATNTVVATDNGTATHIVVDDAITAVTTFLSGPIGNVQFSLDATSTDAAVAVGGAIIQHYAGTFCFTSGINCGGTNYLSGVFDDAAFGGHHRDSAHSAFADGGTGHQRAKAGGGRITSW